MDKRRLKITLKVLDEAKVQFPKTNQFIEQCIEQEYQRKRFFLLV